MTKEKKTKPRSTREDKEDLGEMEKRLKEPGPSIQWKEVKKNLDEAYHLARNLAKEARRQSRLVRKDPKNKKLIDAWEKTADRTGWKC